MIRKIFLHFFILLIAALILVGCSKEQQREPLKIAISKAVPEASYIHYVNWLKTADSTVICQDMYHLSIDSALQIFGEFDGLLLTGGTDVYPGQYGKEKDTSRCWKPDFKRDTLELALIRAALEQQKPILGICRGLQILNVYLGGSLIIDLPTDLDTIVKHQCVDKNQCVHPVTLMEGMLLYEMAGETMGMVNSNHHQGIDRLSPHLTGLANTEDGLIEAIQWRNKNRSPFLMGVQWHPERMDFQNPLSGKIALRFLTEVYHSK
jgi:putative glutamine amidotransferase